MAGKRRILVADDDRLTRQVLTDALENAGYQVFNCADGLEAVSLFQRYKADLVILDVLMPKQDGFVACRRIRELSPVPIVLLTVRGSEEDVVRGLDCGADHYLVKPVKPRELVARINAIMRRAEGILKEPGAPVLRASGLEIDPQRRRVLVEGREATLSPTEFELLYFLASNPGTVFERQVLFRRVWGSEYLGNTNLIDVCVRRLRQKIEPDPAEPRFVLTVRGVGYRFTEEGPAST